MGSDAIRWHVHCSVSVSYTHLFILLGVTLGRFICGFLCPFGWFQDLLHKIPGKKSVYYTHLDVYKRQVQAERCLWHMKT